jgi:hypothetical protein
MKALFGGWQKATKEQAKNYISFLRKNITAMPSHLKDEYIFSERIRGITIEDLFN